MQTFNLRDEWTSLETERALVAAVSQDPALYWELLDSLPAGVFAFDETGEAWALVAEAIEAERKPTAPEWTPASNPQEAAGRLADLLQRRLLAEAMETVAGNLNSERPAAEVLTEAEEAIARAQAAIRATQAGKLTWAAELVGDVLKDAEERARQREETGKAVLGLSTGIQRLDNIISGLNAGLYLLAAGPGVGKTTLALQVAATVARQGAPVVYLTFENSPQNMVMKSVCAWGGINTKDITRGYADMRALRQAAQEWQPEVGERLAMIEGTGRLSVAQVRAMALRAMNRFKAEQCLIVVDYLQLWAKASEELERRRDTRERVEVMGNMLRELAVRLDSPVLAIANQNRAEGRYSGGGAASLDSLKESGDLEYMADVAMFLTKDEKKPITEPARALKLTVAKNRHGDTGYADLIFRPDLGRLAEEDWRHGQ